jgi:mannosyltransferase
MRNRSRLWLPLILIVALVARLIHLGGRNLWYDEAFAVLFAEKGLSAMLYGTLTPVAGGAADIHPLLYYGTLNIWMTVFGESAFAVRLWSVFLGILTVFAIYALTRELFDERTGLAVAFITAIAPFHVQYSQETRMYALLGLLLTLATWCFVRGWRAGNERGWKSWIGWWIGFGVLAGLAMYTQQLAVFYLAALGLVPFVARRKDSIIQLAVGVIVALVVYLPWLVNLPGQLAKVQSYYWLSPPNIAQPLLTARSFLVVNLDIPAPFSMIGFLGALFILLFLIIQVALYLRRRYNPDRRRLLLLLWLAAAPPALMWLISQVQPVYLERALLPSALMLYVALGWMFTRSGLPRPVVGIVGAVGLVLVGIGLYHQYSWATFPNSPYEQAAEAIRGQWQEGDIILHQNKLSALPTIFYARDLRQRYLGDKPGSSEDTLALPTQETLGLLADPCVQAASQGAERVWWVMYDSAEEQYAAAGRTEVQEALDWLETHYTQTEEQQFNDLEVVLYTDPRGQWSKDCSES